MFTFTAGNPMRARAWPEKDVILELWHSFSDISIVGTEVILKNGRIDFKTGRKIKKIAQWSQNNFVTTGACETIRAQYYAMKRLGPTIMLWND